MTFDETVLQQQEAIRKSGETNMFHKSRVQAIAYRNDFYELVTWIEDNDAGTYVKMAEEAAERYRGEDIEYKVEA